MTATAAEVLGEFFAGLKYEAIPEREIAVAKSLVRDYLGVAVGGSTTGSAQIAAQFATVTGGNAEATIIGNGGKVPAVHGAFANAIASHSIELDDVDVLALFHFSPPVVSAALAVAEWQKASGEEFIAAVVAGCEMMARASNATNFSLRDRGFHTTPTCGVFGATIAAARLLKLTAEQTVSALGLAGAQASGLMEMYGPSMQKRFNPGPAARNGVTAARMAKLGYTGAATIFEGDHGFCQAFSDDIHLDKLTEGLGSVYPMHMEYKAYSCARPIHNAIDCALEIRKALREPVSAVKAITMRRHPAWAHYHLNAAPQTYHEAQVSLPYAVAVSLIEGDALPPQFQDAKLHDPQILRLAQMVQVVPDDTLPRGVSCLMILETEGGAELRSQVDHPRGSIVNPMTPEEMDRKAHMLGDPVLGAEGVARMLVLVGRIETVGEIGELMRETASPARG